MELVTGIVEKITSIFTQPGPNTDFLTYIILIAITALLVTLGALWATVWSGRDAAEDIITSTKNIAIAKDKREGQLEGSALTNAQQSLYGSLIQALASNEQYLVNLCPLTASLSGYIGGLDKGVFNAELYIRKALQAGIRSFVLPISTYVDDNKRPPNFPLSGRPAIVCRDRSGKILSLNGLSVREFCEALVRLRGTNSVQQEEPIFLHLFAVDGYVPDSVKEEKQYVEFMKQMAMDLAPIEAYRLVRLGTRGAATGGQNESDILCNTELTEFKNKILITTNFDTKIVLKEAYAQSTPRLHDYVNFIMKPYVEDAVKAAAVGPSARLIRLTDVSGSRINWTDNARTVLHCTGLDDPTKVPNVEELREATVKGIQCIPVPFFFLDGDEAKQTEEIWRQWQGYAFQVKQGAARFAKPPEAKPASLTKAADARVVATLNPGQLQVGVVGASQ